MWTSKAYKLSRLELSQSEAEKLKSEIEQTVKKELDEVLNNAYVPIREAERAIRKLEPISTVMDSVKRLSSLVQKGEALIDETTRKIRQAQNDLEVEIPEPKWLESLRGMVQYGQRNEETARSDARTYSSVYKKLTSVLKEI